MAGGVKVDIDWNEKRVRSQILGEIDRIVAESAYTGERVAKQSARVDTGRMRAGIEVIKLGHMLYALQCIVEYAAANEFGREGDAGQPFMRPGRNAGAAHMRKRSRQAFG